MRVLSLFDGISCGMVALERAGISVEEYHASEIDKYAIKISNKNYPNIIQHGDINTLNFNHFIGKIDLIIGGSPCTDLSIAKKDRQGLKGEHSKLFYKFVEALDIIKPKYFLLENVASMKKEDCAEISKILGVKPIMINSALVSAQNRKRLYWCNWHNTEPQNKGILLHDILESGEAYSSKAKTLLAGYVNAYFPYDFTTTRREMVAERIIQRPHGFNKGKVFEAKSPSITANGYWEQNNLVIKPVRININPSGTGMNGNVIGINQKSGAVLCNKGEGSKIMIPMRLATIGNGGQGNRVYSVHSKSVSLSANGGGRGAKTGLYKIDLPDGDYIIRKLTPLECERLQTLTDGYTEGVSNTRRYKAIGNGWTIDVIVHLFNGLIEAIKKSNEVKSA